VLLKHGEVFLKGRNKSVFEDRLRANLRQALAGIGGRTWIRNRPNITVLGGAVPLDDLIERARRVIGFQLLQPAIEVPSTIDDIATACTGILRDVLAGQPGVTFAIRARRWDKSFPLTSGQVAVTVGARVQSELNLPVNLSSPGVEVSVEIDRKESYISTRRIAGQGGLPVGSSGRALVLLSGGYDSPVAAYRAMRRGLHCDFVHFTGAPYTSPASAYKAYALARELNRYQPAGQLHIIPLGAAQKDLALAGAGRFQVVAQRRLMLRTASALARRSEAEVLVTGDSLGQVASQTLVNLATTDEAASLPVLRPLIAWDKEEIIAEAAAIGTAVISVLPDEDCCQLLAPRAVATRSTPGDLERVERRLDLDRVTGSLLARAQCLRPGSADEPPAGSAPYGGTTDTPAVCDSRAALARG
jgi:thiamine biosynthesis protein ThiI